MNRRTHIKLLTLVGLGLSSLELPAKKKKGNKKKDDKKEKPVDKKITGTVILDEKGLTKSYRLLADKSYSFPRSLEDKIKEFEGQRVTVFGTISRAKIIKISGIINK